MTQKRVSVVTGAAKGIGRAVAEALVAEGDLVVGLDVDAVGLEEVHSGLGAPFVSHVVDVGDKAQTDAIIDRIVADHGALDVLVNNAGITRRAPLEELTEEDWDRIVRVNAKGAFFCLQRAAHHMKAQGSGRIINMASIAGKGFHAASNVIYGGTKGALIAITKMTAHALGPHGITVNAVCPGITETEIYQEIIDGDAARQGIPVEEVKAKSVSAVPIRRANTTHDVAGLVVYLASDAARNVTGQSWNIDGGLIMD